MAPRVHGERRALFATGVRRHLDQYPLGAAYAPRRGGKDRVARCVAAALSVFAIVALGFAVHKNSSEKAHVAEVARQDQLYGGFSLRRKNRIALRPSARPWAASEVYSANGDLIGITDILATERKLIALQVAIEEHERASLKLALDDNDKNSESVFTAVMRDEAALANKERQRSMLEAKLMELVNDLQRRTVGSLRDAGSAPSASQTHAWDLLQQALALRNRLIVDSQLLIKSEASDVLLALLDGDADPRRDADGRAALVAEEEGELIYLPWHSHACESFSQLDSLPLSTTAADGTSIRATEALANLGDALPELIREGVHEGSATAAIVDHPHDAVGDAGLDATHGSEEVHVPGRERRRP